MFDFYFPLSATCYTGEFSNKCTFPISHFQTDRYAQELLLSQNIERMKREEAIVADQNLQNFYNNRLATAVNFPGLAGISGLTPTVAAIVAAQQQAQANNAAVAAAAAQLSANSNNIASSAGATSMSNNPSISTISSSRRRPSLLPHNSGPTSAEAFNLALNSSSSGSTNGSSSLANSRNAGLHFSDREK